MNIGRRGFLGLLWASASAAPPPAIQVAALGPVPPGLPYAGVVLPHDAIASPGKRRLVAVEIRLDKYDARSGLPPREMIERVASAAAAQGAERLILNGRPCYDGRLNRDALTSKCIALNQAGRLCMSKRLGLRYRNGRGEFGGNALEMEEMMLRTNPEVVGVSLDAAEVRRAGADMVNFFARHQNRIDTVIVREWDTVPYTPLSKEIAARKWEGWLVQAPAGVEGRRAITKLFGV